MRPGSLVLAIGHPFGLLDAVSTGVLQSVGELPLELDGQVIGVAAMIVAGMALAVPAPDVEALVASSG